jgi:hypothetical protein
MSVLATVLFRVSSILNALSVIGHVRFGLIQVYPALALVPPQKYRLGAVSARVSYDFINATLVTSCKFSRILLMVLAEVLMSRSAELAMESHWGTRVRGGERDIVCKCDCQCC